MNITLANLNDKLKQIPSISNFYNFYDYIKLETTYSLQNSNEFLVLYLKVNENNLLITDLNALLEESNISGISDKALMQHSLNCGLKFDGISIFTETNIDGIPNTINQFISLIKDLKL